MHDFELLLAKLNANVAPQDHHHSRPGWINFDCPFCGIGSSKYHMGFNRRRLDFNCWKCGRHRQYDTLKALGVSSKDAVAFLRDARPAKELDAPRAAGKLLYPKCGELLPAHEKYLKRRGFNPEEIKTLWNVSATGGFVKLDWRIIIPIYYGTDIVSWTSRAIGKEVEPRYISARPEEERMRHKEILYGEQYAGTSIIVHEGPLDVWATGPGAVCTCGTGYSTQQLLRMSKYARRIICFDAESEAQKRARRLAKDLSVFDGETINVQLETGSDPAEADYEEVAELREFAFGSGV